MPVLVVRSLSGQELVADVSSQDTVISVKQSLVNRLGHGGQPPAAYKLMYLGKELVDTAKLADFNILGNIKFIVHLIPPVGDGPQQSPQAPPAALPSLGAAIASRTSATTAAPASAGDSSAARSSARQSWPDQAPMTVKELQGPAVGHGDVTYGGGTAQATQPQVAPAMLGLLRPGQAAGSIDARSAAASYLSSGGQGSVVDASRGFATAVGPTLLQAGYLAQGPGQDPYAGAGLRASQAATGVGLGIGAPGQATAGPVSALAASAVPQAALSTLPGDGQAQHLRTQLAVALAERDAARQEMAILRARLHEAEDRNAALVAQLQVIASLAATSIAANQGPAGLTGSGGLSA